MNALIFMLIPATIGVDFGWERQPDNSIEYILQIEPEALDSMKTGTELVSSLPPQLRNIRDYRIRVGRDKLPNQNQIPPELGAVATAQPNIASNNYATPNNYAPPNNYATTGNYPPATNAYPAGTYPNNSYPNNAYPNGTAPNNNYQPTNNGFVNNSTAPNYNNPYAGTTASNAGMTPVTGVPTSTSGFPLQTTNATYPTNTTNPTLANLPPPPGTYPNNYTNPYPAGTANPNGYNPSGYAPAGYNNTAAYNPTGYNNTNPYATTGYAPPTNSNFAPQPYPNQQYQNPPYQQTPNPYQYPPQQQYLAMNGGPAPAGYGAAKPSLNDPAGTASNFPQGTQFTQPGTNNLGVPPLNNNPLSGTNPSTLPPAGGFTAGNTLPNGQFTNTGATTNADQHAGATLANGQVQSKEPQSQWASLGFTLVALFASIGVNIYIFSQNHHLRERCRVLIADRAAY